MKRRKEEVSSSLQRKNIIFASRDLHNIGAVFVPFTAQTRMSGVNLDSREVRKGAADAVEEYVKQKGGMFPADVRLIVDDISQTGRNAARGSRGVIKCSALSA